MSSWEVPTFQHEHFPRSPAFIPRLFPTKLPMELVQQLKVIFEEDLAPDGLLAIKGISYSTIAVICLFTYVIYYLFSNSYKIMKLEEFGWLSKEDVKNRRLRKTGKLPPIYPNGWFGVIESSEVKKNEVKHVAVLGENLAVFRNESGEINVLDAICPHLGANMGIGGKVKGNCLECPFHQWQFSGETGECSYAPTVEKTPKANVKKWLSCECNDFVFVWYHAENVEPTWYPTPIKGLEKLSFQGKIEYEANAHIQELIENVSDTIHFNTVHGPVCSTGSDLRTFYKWLNIVRNSFETTWKPEKQPGKSHIAYNIAKHHLILFGKFKMEFGIGEAVTVMEGPGCGQTTMDMPFGPVVLTTFTVPTGPLMLRTIHRFYCPFYYKPFSKLFVFPNVIRMVERDVMVWNYKKFIDKPILIKEESDIARFRRWYSQFYSENSPTYEIAINGLQW